MSKQVAYSGDVTRQRDGISDFPVSVCGVTACQADRARVGQHPMPAPTTKATPSSAHASHRPAARAPLPAHRSAAFCRGHSEP